MRTPWRESPRELMERTYYSPEELADILEVSPYYIRHEVRVGHLKALTVDHRVMTIHRDDVLHWLREYR